MSLNLLLLGLGAQTVKKLDELTCVEIWSQSHRLKATQSACKTSWRSDCFRIRSRFCQSDAIRTRVLLIRCFPVRVFQSDPIRSGFREVSSDSGPRRKTGNKNSPDRGFPRGFQVTKWRALWRFWTANSFNIYFDKGYGKSWFLEIT